jgi:hypothetical protein
MYSKVAGESKQRRGLVEVVRELGVRYVELSLEINFSGNNFFLLFLPRPFFSFFSFPLTVGSTMVPRQHYCAMCHSQWCIFRYMED